MSYRDHSAPGFSHCCHLRASSASTGESRGAQESEGSYDPPKDQRDTVERGLGIVGSYDALRFEALNHYFPHLNSAREFIMSSDYLGDTEITF